MVMPRVTSIGEKISLFLIEGDKVSQCVYPNFLGNKLVPWIILTFVESVKYSPAGRNHVQHSKLRPGVVGEAHRSVLAEGILSCLISRSETLECSGK